MKIVIGGDTKAIENIIREKSILVRRGLITIDVYEDNEKSNPETVKKRGRGRPLSSENDDETE
ncbi:hypothetical protein IR083_20930 [Dysgonomonas sp. GY75]|uniref:hypothetical protein n=1 Tax=Dysgonomonas sp. GY75 TaxID=2780419 RepID=UPI0018836438|nr:hypothetical protein [Dysgonomonas sp. GY75]MBF0651287.1 hypothetical protein [Dysgonomonas sp. GY75]